MDAVIIIGSEDDPAPALCERARQLGLRAVSAPVAASAAAVEADLRRGLRHPPTVIGVVGADPDSAPDVARLARAYGLPACDEDAAVLAVDKVAQKVRLAENGIRIPSFRRAETPADLPDNWIGGIVLKPAMGRRALRLGPRIGHEWALNQAKMHGADGCGVIAERWVDGPAARCVAVLSGGSVAWVGCAHLCLDRLDEFRPWVVIDGWTAPYGGALLAHHAGRLIGDACGALGWRDGIVAADIVQRLGDLYLVSLDLGLPGRHLATTVLPLAYGVDLTRAALDIAAGLAPHLPSGRPESLGAVCVAQRYVWPAPDDSGLFVHKLRPPVGHPGIARWELSVKVGDIVGPPDHVSDAWGVVIAHGPSVDEAERAAERFGAEIYASVRLK